MESKAPLPPPGLRGKEVEGEGLGGRNEKLDYGKDFPVT